MDKNDITNAYIRIRSVDSTIPSDVLELMRQSAIEKLEENKSKRLFKIREELFHMANDFAPHINALLLHNACNLINDVGLDLQKNPSSG